MPEGKRSTARWKAGTLVLDNTVVGTVDRGAGGDWFAYGCLNDWQDVKLGCHETEQKARRAVEGWVEEMRED
jgi:hypothetical protein